jgi:hypothetical protein
MSQTNKQLAEFGSINVGGRKVLGTQSAAITSVPAVTTIGANTGTPAAGLSLIGDTTAVNQATNIMNDLASNQEDVAALRTTVNSILTALRSHGIIAT